jgi:hypothetical protein
VAFVVSIDASEPNAVVAQLHALAALDETERSSLAAQCRSEAERLFRPTVVADQLEVALRELLG